MIKKLGSRKLWAAAAGFVAGLAMVFGLDDDVVNTMSGAVVSVASVVTYIYNEARVDAASVESEEQKAQSDSGGNL